MKRFGTSLIGGLGFALLGAVLTVIGGYVLWARAQPPLQLWHQVSLEEEFTAAKAARIATLDDYLALETRVYDELNAKIYAKTPTGPMQRLNRFSPGSAADPRERRPNWNRTFELVPEDPVGGVLLLHGMSDGPYSLRVLGEALHAKGYRVLGLRMPGHGTAPAGLLTVTWEDMAAATRLGTRHLEHVLDGKPLHVMGYSTGAALALDYTLDAMEDMTRAATEEVTLAVPASLVLVSPAIGITPLAKLTRLFDLMGRLPGLGQLAWTSLVPEFDPFNYNAFTANASLQVHRMTRANAARIRRLSAAAPIEGFPATLVLLTVVDATVSPQAAVDHLLRHLAPDTHELLLYDINRQALKAPLLVANTAALSEQLLADETLPFTLTLVANRSDASRRVMLYQKPPFTASAAPGKSLDAAWPEDTLSLSHVDLPFPPDDPLYGRDPPQRPGQVFLGQLAIRGERGVLKVPAQWLLRLRHNPFYSYQRERVLNWVDRGNVRGEG
ncbi:Thermostable monoacylglycerol lipase [Thiorhodovibrio winogradskyi]|uniref:Thermostable monoacylglycerol lipase n=1 Tax=Thiorhodovibrio winogradskyi TaxID=77007 RepID=A0ABZ0S9H7_9GAMM|nr:alpha/beta fold hydrolase [Thiorhodovibrio winogradskyi]